MPDLLQSGQAWLADQLHEHVATEVTYRRGAEELTVRATIGRTLLKLDDGYGGVRLEWTDRDYLIRAADLALGGSPTQPQRGDQIREAVGAQTLVYEVLAPGDEPPWRWADPHRRMVRIHTKQIATEA
ncbi:MAG TPA: hypothetical protein PJ982_05515 [Lacipirellulaceae bacterium]|nr:hypothetical protein [Lacipirellulaceae bacterium]